MKLPIKLPHENEAKAARLFFFQSSAPAAINVPAVAQSMAACIPGLIALGRGLVASSVSLVESGIRFVSSLQGRCFDTRASGIEKLNDLKQSAARLHRLTRGETPHTELSQCLAP